MRSSKLKYCKWIGFLIFPVLALFYFPKGDLHPQNIRSPLKQHSQWEIALPTQEERAKIDEIFNQPFTYLSEGGQSLIFVAADQKYILKLFKFKRFRPSVFVEYLPGVFPFKSYKDRHITKREKKLTTAFTGYKLAYDLHKKESGLIFVQLAPCPSAYSVIITDKNNTRKKINLEKASFILQKKGEILSAELSNILTEGNLPLAKERIEQVLNLYLSEYQKGLHDLDYGVMHNIGCYKGKVFHLDAGKLILNKSITEREFYQKSLIKIASKLKDWVSKNYPQYSQELNQYIETTFNSSLES